MEGLAGVHLRRLLTAQGGFDWVVSEFVRVVDKPLPDHVFHRICPELEAGGKTRSGTPVRVQLLGNHLEAMAANAHRAAELGAFGIDINFGCPSKTVNRSQGGAVLLKEPETLYRVVKAVREALPASMVVSAKMRLGFDDTSLMLDNARAVASAGASELTVHARTRQQGYAPPAHWHELARIREAVSLPLIANGDIWTVTDYERCVEVSGLTDVMLGRGAVRRPSLARQIRAGREEAPDWAPVSELLLAFWFDMKAGLARKYWTGRVKQWLNHLRHVYPEAEQLWTDVRRHHDPAVVESLLLADGPTTDIAV